MSIKKLFSNRKKDSKSDSYEKVKRKASYRMAMVRSGKFVAKSDKRICVLTADEEEVTAN